MKNLKTLLILTAMLAGASSAYAASHVGAMATAAAADMADGEVRKVDTATKKITIKHGEIKNLDMPGMTMMFQVKDSAMLDKLKAGDKIRFRAEKVNGAIMVTEIQPAK